MAYNRINSCLPEDYAQLVGAKEEGRFSGPSGLIRCLEQLPLFVTARPTSVGTTRNFRMSYSRPPTSSMMKGSPDEHSDRQRPGRSCLIAATFKRPVLPVGRLAQVSQKQAKTRKVRRVRRLPHAVVKPLP